MPDRQHPRQTRRPVRTRNTTQIDDYARRAGCRVFAGCVETTGRRALSAPASAAFSSGRGSGGLRPAQRPLEAQEREVPGHRNPSLTLRVGIVRDSTVRGEPGGVSLFRLFQRHGVSYCSKSNLGDSTVRRDPRGVSLVRLDEAASPRNGGSGLCGPCGVGPGQSLKDH